MIDFDSIRRLIVKGLKDYLKIAVIRSNQAGTPPPYPYLSYTITSPSSQNKGSYGVYSDGLRRKPITQGLSFTIQSDDAIKVMELALKAKDWFEYYGNPYFDEHDIIVQSVSGIANRDNLLTIEYEYRLGFDVVLWLLNEVDSNDETTGVIETVDLSGIEIESPSTVDELNEMLER